MTAGEIADEFHLSQSAMSAHFTVLRSAGLIADEKEGSTITYTPPLSALEDALLGFADAVGVGRAQSLGNVQYAARHRHAT
jgi:DNA-binding transcriptional ArsR family regulator